MNRLEMEISWATVSGTDDGKHFEIQGILGYRYREALED